MPRNEITAGKILNFYFHQILFHKYFSFGQIALNILQLSATSAPTERSFSAQGRIHSKPKNRLLTERAAKLTFIAFNSTTLLRKPNNKFDDILKQAENVVDEKDDDDESFLSDSEIEIEGFSDSDNDTVNVDVDIGNSDNNQL